MSAIKYNMSAKDIKNTYCAISPKFDHVSIPSSIIIYKQINKEFSINKTKTYLFINTYIKDGLIFSISFITNMTERSENSGFQAFKVN